MAVILFIPHFEKVDLIIASSARFYFLSKIILWQIMPRPSRKLLIGQNLLSAFLIVLQFAFSEMHENVGNNLSKIICFIDKPVLLAWLQIFKIIFTSLL